MGTVALLSCMILSFDVSYSIVDYDQFSFMLQRSQQSQFMSITATSIDCIRHQKRTVYIAMNNTIRIEKLGEMNVLYIPLAAESQDGTIIDIVPFSEINSMAVNVYYDKCNCSSIAIIAYDFVGTTFETMYLNQFECYVTITKILK